MNGTDRSKRLCVWMVVLTLFFTGCGLSDTSGTESQAPTVIQQETQAHTELVESNQKPGTETGFVHSHPLGSTVFYDLDGDGADEDITVNAQEYADGKLTIGNVSMEFMAVNPTGYFTIVNVDQSVDMLLVGISDYGFSDDDMTVLYAYAGGQIAQVGYFADILGQNSYNKAGAVCHGDGTISARVRMDVLGTWTAMGLYQMGEAGLEDHTDLYRRMDWEDRIIGWEVTTKMELTMYADAAQTSEQVIVPAETMVRMTGVKTEQGDSTHWVCFEVDSLDKTLWLFTQEIDWQTYVQTDDGLIDSEEIFEGFFYAG